MAETAAHLVDHVFPPLPVRQWVLAVPKRLRYFLQADAALQGTVLRIFLSVVERCLREHSPSSPADARIGAVAFIHRFGSSLNEHVHFHCCVIDGVFESTADTDNAPKEAPSVSFHAALELDAAAFADVQARVRTRVLSTFVRRGLIDKDDAAEMRAWAHDGGFSVDGSVRIEGADRVGARTSAALLCSSAFRAGASAPTRCRASGLPQSQAGSWNSAPHTPGGAGADATRTDHEDRRAGAATKGRIVIAITACSRPMHRYALW
jgi:hypothetical protein